jgi:hypothetical protein
LIRLAIAAAAGAGIACVVTFLRNRLLHWKHLRLEEERIIRLPKGSRPRSAEQSGDHETQRARMRSSV